ncbi:MAG: hypothetical protein ICV75_07280 [Nitrospiraceae bacterium]|nr:hypothetical protein [Nitrospiraceae bacterium]
MTEVRRMTVLFLSQAGGPLLFVGVALVLSIVSCSGGSSPTASTPTVSSSGNQPPVITSAQLLQNPLSLDAPIAVQIHAEDPEREAVTFQYQWYVNGVEAKGQTNATLPADSLRRGHMITARIVPSDGTQKGNAFWTEAVPVGNTAPRISSVTLAPLAAMAGATLQAHAEVSDPDHDRVELAYRWYKNNDVIKEGEDASLETTGFRSRDQIAVEVTARDPSGLGNAMRSDILVLTNSLPKILSTPPPSTTSERYEYAVKAVDADADKLVYQLDMAPPGMTIDEQSGHIAWQIPSGQHGTFHIKVIARDGQGGEAHQEFDLHLSIS